MMPDYPVMLITGASRGIGRYLSGYYADLGYRVVGCSRKTADPVAGCEFIQADVTNEGQVRELIAGIQTHYGRLDILINNAGIASMNHILLTPTKSVTDIMATNFIGTFLLCREASRLMRKCKKGRIVNFSTIAVPMKLEGEAIYAASKSAVTTFSKILARELAPFNITCNVIGPTPIETDLIRSVAKEKIHKIIERLAIKRLGTFSDVVNVIDFFIREESNYITGQVIYLGGE